MKNTILSILLLVSVSAMAIESSHDKGYNAFVSGDYETAKTEFTQALKLEPNNAELFYNLAITELKLGQFAEAQKDFQTASNLIK